MEKSNNTKKIEWIASIMSIIGLLILIAGPKHIETTYDLERIGLGIIGISIMVYLFFGDKSD